jgi:hypothetical protein
MSSTSVLDISSFPPACAELLAGERLCELGPGTSRPSLRSVLSTLDDRRLFGERPVVDPEMASACRAGLWLLHDFLDESHRISQRIETPSGSYWHGIMHRREPDYWNAKYWFQRVGRHEIFGRLGALSRELAVDADGPARFLRDQIAWNSPAFVDLCESVTREAATYELLCRQIARLEWELLFDCCYRRAVGD